MAMAAGSFLSQSIAVETIPAIFHPATAAPMPMRALVTKSLWSRHQLTMSSSFSMTGLTSSAMLLNTSPTVDPNDLNSPPVLFNPNMFWMHSQNRSLTLATTSMAVPNTSIHASNTPVSVNPCTNSMTLSMPFLSVSVAHDTLSMMVPMTCAAVHPNPSMVLVGKSLSHLTESNACTSLSHALRSTSMAPMSLSFLYRLSNALVVRLTMSAAAVPIFVKFEVNLLIALLILSTPNASMTFWMAFATRFFAFSTAVPMPWVASLAWSAKLAYLPKPSRLSLTTALLKSWNETFPSFISSYRSFAFLPAPSMDSASWLSWPGIAACMLRHAAMSTLPAASC